MIQDITPHKYDVSYRITEAGEQDVMLIYQKDSLLCHTEENEITYPSVKEITEAVPDVCKKARYLFRIDNQNYFELP